MNSKHGSIIQSNAFIYILAFMLGWCSYSLKLVSIIKLLGELDFGLYPILMVAQGISLFVSMNVLTKVSRESEKLFYLLTLATGFLIVFITSTVSFNQWAIAQYGWLYSCVIFLLTTFIILAIDITTRLLVTSKISMLKNPKAAVVVTFAGETGIILGAVLTLLMAQFMETLPLFLNPFVMSIPFTLSLLCLYLVTKAPATSRVETENEQIKTMLGQHSEDLKHSARKFLPYLVALITIVMICKHFQGFAVFVGLKEWQEASNKTIPTMFSILAIIQNGLILAFMIPSLFSKSKSTSWTRGYKYFFGFQAMSMFLITIYPVAATLIGTGVIRKITQRSFLNKSFNMLTSSIPDDIRFKAKSTAQQYGHSLAYLLLAFFSYLAIYNFIAFQVVWLIAGIAALLGFWLVYLLLKKLNSFHMQNIKEFVDRPFNIYEVISSSFALANRDAINYQKDITDILQHKKNRSIFIKALIHTLGEMRSKDSIDFLMRSFRHYQREDIQLEILRSLDKFKYRKIDLFFIKVLEETMLNDTNRGELKISFCETISSRIPKPSLVLATEMINSHPENENIIGNAVDVLGDIAARGQTKKIYKYLSAFLAPNYSRRIRINTIKHIYSDETYHQQVHDNIQSLQASDNFDDRTGAVYLCGVLGLKEYLPYINEFNLETDKKNSTILLTLLRLEQKDADVDFLNLLLSASEQDRRQYIKQLHRVSKDSQRYAVYNRLLERYPERVSEVLFLMRDSQRNFDKDRELIIEEAERTGIKISDELIYQLH